MPHLKSPRAGWIGEHLALYILSKFAFVSQPVTVADDLGSDFLCTLFKTHGQSLLPTCSFAVQVKHCLRRPRHFEVTKHLTYLSNIEIPFFFGIANSRHSTLSLYSGEALTHFFALHGIPTSRRANARVFVCLSDEWPKQPCEVDGERYFISFPLLATISSADSADSSPATHRAISLACKTMTSNIVSSKNHEYIFPEFGGEQKRLVFYAGEGSAQYFMPNLHMRVAEALRNIIWLRQNGYVLPAKQYEALDTIYSALSDLAVLPYYLTQIHEWYTKIRESGA